MAEQWFYSGDGTKQGPVSSRELVALARSGKLRPAGLVWKEGMPEWQAAGKVKGLFPTNLTAPPPLPTPAPEVAPPDIATATKGLLASVASSAKRNLLSRRTKVLAGVASGVLLLSCLIFGASAIVGDRAGTSPTKNPSGNSPTKNSSKDRTSGQLDMTVEEFRKALHGDNFDPKSWCPKKNFYDEFGEPKRISTIGDHTYLSYQCKNGTARIECGKGEFQHLDTIRPLAVDEQ